MKKSRRRFSAAFKTKVVLETIKERKTMAELASEFDLHPNQISQWKREFLDNAESAFGDHSVTDQLKTAEHEKDELYKQVGRLQMENEWLKKKVL